MLRTVYISFPGLGIGEFKVSNVAFTVFGHPVAWYGIIITFGIIMAALYVLYRAKQEGVIADDVLDLGIWVVLFGVIGARAYFVLTSLDRYESFWDVFKIWNGGLAIYGGIIAGIATIVVFCRIKKHNLFVFLDMCGPAAMLGQIIGRWGNFVNGEAHGGLTDIFCRMGLRFSEYSQVAYVHPTFLYESLWNTIGFILINIFYKKKRYNGQVALWYLAWYGFGRMFIEQLRTDSLYVLGFRISSLVGFGCFLAFGGILLYHAIKKTKMPTAYSNSKEEE